MKEANCKRIVDDGVNQVQLRREKGPRSIRTSDFAWMSTSMEGYVRNGSLPLGCGKKTKKEPQT